MSTRAAYYTRELGRLVARAAKPDKIAIIHVMPGRGETWSVVVHGRVKSLRSSLGKSEAISLAKKTAIRLAAEYVSIHDKTGNVIKRIDVRKHTPAT